jgi:hypothetical protein
VDHPSDVRGRRRLFEWDTAPFPDYNGRWCDRLLLGPEGAATRSAVLEPLPGMEHESVLRVLRTHRHLRSSDVLVVRAAPDMAMAHMRFRALVQADATYAAAAKSWAELISGVGTSQEFLSLCVGVGSAEPLMAPLRDISEKAVVGQRVLPLGAFACALWACSPSKAVEYIDTETAVGLLAPSLREERLWRTMQASMLSTRDAAVLEAYSQGRSVDRNLRGDATVYQAQQLLHEERGNVSGRW